MAILQDTLHGMQWQARYRGIWFANVPTRQEAERIEDLGRELLAHGLPMRVVSTLLRNGCRSLTQLHQLTDQEILDSRMCGPATLAALRGVLPTMPVAPSVDVECYDVLLGRVAPG